jgi:hypothetical protein
MLDHWSQGEPEMAICEWCDQEYEQSKWWQRFCCSKHKDDWHNHQKSLALRQEAEEQREARLVNGDAGKHKPLSEILYLKPATLLKPEPSLKRRAW